MDVIYYSKCEDEYLLRFPPIPGIGSYELSVPAKAEANEDLEQYLQEQIQNEIDGSGLDERIAVSLEECLYNCCFEEEEMDDEPLPSETLAFLQRQLWLNNRVLHFCRSYAAHPEFDDFLR